MAKVTVEETDGSFDFDVADEETEIIPGRERIPICVCVSKIGDGLVIDSTTLEEFCASSCVYVIVDMEGIVCGVQNGLRGSMDPSVLINMIQVSF